MRARTLVTIFSLALLGAVPPCQLWAAPQTVLMVGRPVAMRPPALPVSVICDDTSIVRVDDAGDHLVVTGLRPGATDCSFGTLSAPGRRLLRRFEVRPAQ